jgi:hypothetical protein
LVDRFLELAGAMIKMEDNMVELFRFPNEVSYRGPTLRAPRSPRLAFDFDSIGPAETPYFVVSGRWHHGQLNSSLGS